MHFSAALAWVPVSFKDTWIRLLPPCLWQLFMHCAASCTPVHHVLLDQETWMSQWQWSHTTRLVSQNWELDSLNLWQFSLRWAVRPHQCCCYTEELETKAWHLWLVTSAGLDQCPKATLCVGYNFDLPSFTYSFCWPEHFQFYIADAVRAANSCWFSIRVGCISGSTEMAL